MSFYGNDTADVIQSWGLKNPATIEKLLQSLDAVEQAGAEQPALDKLEDPKQAAKQVLALAEWKSSQGEHLAQAKNTARAQLTTAIEHALNDSAEFYLEQLEDGLDDTVRAYRAAVEQLPNRFTAEDVLNFSPEKFEAYQEAKSHAATVSGVLSMVQTLAMVVPSQKYINVEEPLFLLLDPVDLETYYFIATATDDHDNAQRQVLPLVATALAHGAKVSLKTPEEVQATIDYWEAQRATLKDQEHRELCSRVKNWE